MVRVIVVLDLWFCVAVVEVEGVGPAPWHMAFTWDDGFWTL